MEQISAFGSPFIITMRDLYQNVAYIWQQFDICWVFCDGFSSLID